MSEIKIDPAAVQRMIEACEQAARAFREVGKTCAKVGAMLCRPVSQRLASRIETALREEPPTESD